MKRASIFFYFYLCILIPISSQTISDAGLWSTINIEKKLNKKTSLFLTEEYRLKENFSQTNLFFTEFGAEYKVFSNLRTSFSYRLSEKRKEDLTFAIRHRLSLNLTFKKEFTDNLTFMYRQRIQTEVAEFYSSKNGKTPDWLYRHKFSLKYKINKSFSPYISYEIRYQIYDPNAIEANKLFNRNRYVAGLNYKLNKRNSFEIYYLIQNEFNVSKQGKDYIIGLEYTFSL